MLLWTVADTKTQTSVLVDLCKRNTSCNLWANLRGKPNILQHIATSKYLCFRIEFMENSTWHYLSIYIYNIYIYIYSFIYCCLTNYLYLWNWEFKTQFASYCLILVYVRVWFWKQCGRLLAFGTPLYPPISQDVQTSSHLRMVFLVSFSYASEVPFPNFRQQRWQLCVNGKKPWRWRQLLLMGGIPELIQHFFGPKNTGHTWKYITELWHLQVGQNITYEHGITNQLQVLFGL